MGRSKQTAFPPSSTLTPRQQLINVGYDYLLLKNFHEASLGPDEDERKQIIADIIAAFKGIDTPSLRRELAFYRQN